MLFRNRKNSDTVVARHLKGRKWTDKSVMMAHCMFEILSKFVEDELDGSDTDESIASEIRELYDWWHNTYIPFDAFSVHEKEIENCKPISFEVPVYGGEGDIIGYEWDRYFREETHEAEYNRLMNKIIDDDREMQALLKENLHRVVVLSDHFWV